MPESTFEKIIRKSGQKPTSCKCQKCKTCCQKAPGLGTPEEIRKLVNAGYVNRLMITAYAFPVVLGIHPEPVTVIAPEFDQEKGACTFFENGLCILHDQGLKPMECRLAHHTGDLAGKIPKKSVGWLVAKEWLDGGWTEEKAEDYMINAATLQAISDSAKLFAQERQEAHDRFTKLFARPAQKPAEENY